MLLELFKNIIAPVLDALLLEDPPRTKKYFEESE